MKITNYIIQGVTVTECFISIKPKKTDKDIVADFWRRANKSVGSYIEKITDAIIADVAEKTGTEPLTEQFRDEAEDIIATIAVDPEAWYARGYHKEDPVRILIPLWLALTPDVIRELYKEIIEGRGPEAFCEEYYKD